MNNKDRYANNFDANTNNENCNDEKDSNAQNNLNSNYNNSGAIIVKEKVSKYLGIKYFTLATVFSIIAYMFRMNSLIFVIATVIYLLFNLFTKITSKTAKENIINIFAIILYIIISIIPSQIVNDYYISKYNLDKSKAYPNISYILIGSNVLKKTLFNLKKGILFDENTLMTIATIGAFLIGEFQEAVAVMIFSRIGEFIQDKAINKSRLSISKLMDIKPETANLEIENSIKTVHPSEIKIGDIIVVKPG